MNVLSSCAKDVLRQLFLNGPTWDGDIISKAGRGELVQAHWADHCHGYAWLTAAGIKLAIDLGFDREKERRDHDRFTLFRIGHDHSGHEYVYPMTCQDEWEAWKSLPEDDERSWQEPDFAFRIDGSFVFSWPIINDEAVVRKLRVAKVVF